MSELEDLGNLFRLLAEIDLPNGSPMYTHLARTAADDPEVLSLLLPAGPGDRLPHLLFAAVQYLLLPDAIPVLSDYERFRAWCLSHRHDIEAIVATHVIQTNEVGRCAAMLPCLADVAASAGRPLAVLEVGASAGLNLLFDRYQYVFADVSVGPSSPVVLRPEVSAGRAVSMPAVGWRCGLDRKPVDITDEASVRWLRSCIWPEQVERVAVFEQAVAIARQDPPRIVQGDAFDGLPDLVRQVPPEFALCVMHTAVMAYLPDFGRLGPLIESLADERPIWWLSGEPAGLISALADASAPGEGMSFLYGVVPFGADGEKPRAIARAGTHGAWIEWL